VDEHQRDEERTAFEVLQQVVEGAAQEVEGAAKHVQGAAQQVEGAAEHVEETVQRFRREQEELSSRIREALAVAMAGKPIGGQVAADFAAQELEHGQPPVAAGIDTSAIQKELAESAAKADDARSKAEASRERLRELAARAR